MLTRGRLRPVFLKMPVMQQAQAYIAEAARLFDEQDQVKSPQTREFLGRVISAFAVRAGD